MRCSPRMPVSISDLEKEPLEADCCDNEDCGAPEPVIEIHVKEEELPEIEEVEELPEPDPVEELVVPPVVSAPAGELLRKILLAEGISEGVIGKHQIIETFEGWYDGVIDDASVRASIQDFKAAQGGVIKAKLSRVQ